MTKPKKISTQAKIKAAAHKLFTLHGFAGTTTRDIAAEADINIASLHYHFNTKQKLFEIVAIEALSGFGDLMRNVVEGDDPFHVIIERFSDLVIDFYKERPFLPLFMLAETENDPDKMAQHLDYGQINRVIAHHLEQIQALNLGPKIEAPQLIANLVGATLFPFMSRKVFYREFDFDDVSFDKFLNERKKVIADWIIQSAYFEDPRKKI